MTKFKICADEDCLQTFTPYTSTQRYCSYQCLIKNKKVHKPLLKRNKISKKSKKQKELDRLYFQLRKIFLNKPENKFCAVYPDKLATEVHHKAGRTGKLYLYVKFWLAVSVEGHAFINENPAKAYKKGWLIKSTTAKI